MSGVNRVMRRCPRSSVAGAMVAIGVLVPAAISLSAETGSPGPLAQFCGVPPAGAAVTQAKGQGKGQGRAKTGVPVFPAGQYPVKLPAVSMLGARNDLPNPYRPGVSWGQLPEGRKWGSVASVTIDPDGKLW